eukprot:scaffold1720_cov238-Pinguiococcus_pyrenoidosus.AAC.5
MPGPTHFQTLLGSWAEAHQLRQALLLGVWNPCHGWLAGDARLPFARSSIREVSRSLRGASRFGKLADSIEHKEARRRWA